MPEWKNDDDMFSLMQERLYTPVVGDILDAMGYCHQFLPPEIRPMRDDMKLAGRAMTVLMIDVFGPQKKPFGLLTEALDQLEKNEIYIATGGLKRCAYWGELLTATSRCRGATGAARGRRARRGRARPPRWRPWSRCRRRRPRARRRAPRACGAARARRRGPG